MRVRRQTLRVLIIGAGTIARVHTAAYRHVAGVTVAGLVDPRANERQWDVRVWRTLEEAPATDYDVLDICAPTYLHRDYALEGARLGKAVFCEKPAALCADDVRIMTDTLRAKGLPFMVGHVVRFFPEYEAARALVAEQRLGRVGVARFNRVSARPRGWNDWYRDPKLSGGTLFDLLIHDIDFVRWTLGPVARVFARTVTDSASGCDLSLATLRCQTGAIVHLFGSWAHGRFATRFEIAGSQGLITYDRDRARSLWLERSAVGKREEAGVEVPTAVGTLGPFEKELQAWVDCVNSGTDPPVSGEDGFEALRILEELRHSADTGQAQTLMNSGAADTSGTEGGLCP